MLRSVWETSTHRVAGFCRFHLSSFFSTAVCTTAGLTQRDPTFGLMWGEEDYPAERWIHGCEAVAQLVETVV